MGLMFIYWYKAPQMYCGLPINLLVQQTVWSVRDVFKDVFCFFFLIYFLKFILKSQGADLLTNSASVTGEEYTELLAGVCACAETLQSR